MAHYLVTGAAGFIGGALSRELLVRGHSVTSIDNLSTGFRENVPEGVKFIEGDCADPDIYRFVSGEPLAAIFHIAGQSSGEISFDDPIYDIRTNTESTLLLLKYAVGCGCSRFIYASTMSVYGKVGKDAVSEGQPCRPESFYGVSKLASEHYMRLYQQYGVNSTALRLFNVYGPGQNLSNLRQGMVSIFLAQMIKNGTIHVKGASDRFRDFIFIDDVVECFARCLEKQASWGESINVATSRKTTVRELISTLMDQFGREVQVEYSGSTDGDIAGIVADNSKMKLVLGVENTTPLEEGLRMMFDWAGRMNHEF